jgi:hypothetical protein
LGHQVIGDLEMFLVVLLLNRPDRLFYSQNYEEMLSTARPECVLDAGGLNERVLIGALPPRRPDAGNHSLLL